MTIGFFTKKSFKSETFKLFIEQYLEQLQKTFVVKTFVQSVWAFIGPNKLPGIVDDAVAFLCLSRLHSTHWMSAAGIIIIALCLYRHSIEPLQIFILCS